ncbi:MAG: alkaline phosphatase family protein [Myxococcota bacterium]
MRIQGKARWVGVGARGWASALVFSCAIVSSAGCQSPQSRLTAVQIPANTPMASESTTALTPGTRATPTESVVLIALDGVRWQDVYVGVDRGMAEAEGIPEAFILPADQLLPNIHHRVIARGVALGAPGHGAPMRASGPNHLSLPGYMEMLSGVVPETCRDNNCPPTRTPTLVDAFRDAVGPEGGHVGVVTSWETIERAAAVDSRGIALSTGRTGGKTRETLRSDPVLSDLLDVGAQVGPHPGHGDYRSDYYTAAVALRYLSTRRPRFLFVGLGDTDEWGHQDNYEAYLQSLRFADTFVGSVLDTLEMLGTYGTRTTVIVTADHGRSDDFVGHGRSPESGRVWLVATGGVIPAVGYVDAPRERRLADVAPTIRSLVGLPDPNGDGDVLAELFEPVAAGAAVAQR